MLAHRTVGLASHQCSEHRTRRSHNGSLCSIPIRMESIPQRCSLCLVRPATPLVGARRVNQTAVPARRTSQCLGIRTSGARAHGATRGRSPVLSDAEPQIEGGGGSERMHRPPPESRGRQINEASIERRSRPPATPRSPPGPVEGSRRGGRRSRRATWLILPLVTCLSPRLSHACVTIN